MSSAATAPVALDVRLPEDPVARVAFSGRAAGNVSLVVGGGEPHANRARLAGIVGLPGGDVVFMQQVHGSAVATVGRDDAGRGLDAHEDALAGVDALVTRETDLALVVLVADCVPVVLVDPGAAVAAVHAGRRGVAGGLVGTAVTTLTDRPERVVAVMGPAIGGCCYELDEDSIAEVTASVPSARTRTRWGTPALDLPGAVTEQLARAGVRTVRRVGACTRCASDRWFSHRADTGPAQGRQAGIVCRRETRSDLHRQKPVLA